MTPLRRFAPFVLFLAVCLGWSYWPTLEDIVERWSHDPSYSHGFIVPLFAAYLLWLNRARMPEIAPSQWGFGLLSFALAARLAGTYFHFTWFDQLSIVPCLAGLVWILAGGRFVH